MSSPMTLVQPSGELLDKIREERNEDLKTRDDYVANVKEWLKQQPHLPDDWDSRIILNFLRGSSFSLEKCKRKIDMFFTLRTACPEWSSDRDPTSPELQKAFSIGSSTPLPGLTPAGCRVILGTGSLASDIINTTLKVNLMTADLRLRDEVEGVAGEVMILDCRSANVASLAKAPVTEAKKLTIFAQKGYPAKVKEMHFVNGNAIMEAYVAILKPFVSAKIGSRLFVHTDMKSLHKYVPKEMLPEEYGGDLGPLNTFVSSWVKTLEENKDWFKADEANKANESLRPGKPTNYSEIFGMEGSFRQLTID